MNRLIFSLGAVAAALASGERLAAQWRLDFDAGALGTAVGKGETGGLGLGTGIHYDRPRVSLRATGIMTDDGRNDVELGAVYRQPIIGPLRLTLEASGREHALIPGLNSRSAAAKASLALAWKNTGVWLGGSAGAASGIPTWSVAGDSAGVPLGEGVATPNRRPIDPRFGSRRVEAGGWQRVGPLVFRATIAAGRFMTEEWAINLIYPNDSLPPLYDSVLTLKTRTYGDGLVGLTFAQGPAVLSAAVGSRLGRALDQSGLWGSITGTVQVHPRLALIASAARYPDEPGLGLPARQSVFAGVRVGATPFRKGSPEEVQPGASTFIIRNLGPNNYVLLVRAVDAAAVELQGDFTDWESIVLNRAEADLWEAPFQLESGPHRLVIRVDGGHWTPPPGLRTVPDDFYGTVGLIVIP